MGNTGNSQATENKEMEKLQKQLAEAEARAKAAEEQAAAEKENAAKATAEKEAAEKAAAEAEAKLQAEAEKTVETKPDTVRIKIPFERNSANEDVQVFINGRQYIIQRGIEVDVPRGVAEILANREKMLQVIDAFNRKNEKKD